MATLLCISLNRIKNRVILWGFMLTPLPLTLISKRLSV
jgi:hypothetical protein